MLRLEAVDAGYASTVVLRDVDLDVPESSVCALIGPNGAGKTTLLRVASGLVKPSRGRLVIDDRDVTNATPIQLAEAGVCHIPERGGVFRSLTVRENLILFSSPGREEQAIERATDAFPRLRERLHQVAGTLSGGEQQMLALSRAYVGDARIVLLDEVSMGLAPVIVDEIFAFLARLAAEGRALLLVEQYVTRALEIAEYVYMLDRGRVGFRGEPAELIADEVFDRYLGAGARE